MEREIEEKRVQMRDLEKQIVESNEASISNTSLADMQQVHSPSPLLNFSFRRFIVYYLYFIKFYQHLLLFPSLKQTMMKLMTQCDEKGFELEVSMLFRYPWSLCCIGKYNNLLNITKSNYKFMVLTFYANL